MTIYTFDFVQNEMDRNMLQNMAQVITEYNLWDYINSFEDTKFVWSGSEEIKKISQHELTNHHTGASFTLTMGLIHKICKIGYEKFKQQYLESRYGNTYSEKVEK